MTRRPRASSGRRETMDAYEMLEALLRGAEFRFRNGTVNPLHE